MESDSGTIDRALKVLREASAAETTVQTLGVALALWVLRGHCPDNWLVAFWDAAGVKQVIGRQQSLNANYNGIALRVRDK